MSAALTRLPRQPFAGQLDDTLAALQRRDQAGAADALAEARSRWSRPPWRLLDEIDRIARLIADGALGMAETDLLCLTTHRDRRAVETAYREHMARQGHPQHKDTAA